MEKFKKIAGILIVAALAGYVYYDMYYPRPYALASTFISKDLSNGGMTSVREEVKFEIDGQPYTVTANPGDMDVAALSVGPGRHTVTRGGKTLGEIDIGWFDGKSIINLDMEPLVVVDVVYAENREKYNEKLNSLPQNTITVNGRQYTGPFRYIEPALYLKKDWDYSPAEPTPSEIQSKSAATVKTELMRLYKFESRFGEAAR
ncbi:MAG: hypothetical protein Q3966_07915 [Neisseria sp.]|nr:hypothetical protein [Neisseria sp.]